MRCLVPERDEDFGCGKTGSLKISAQETSGILAKSRRVSGGVCSIYKERSSEMTVFTVVPSSVMTQGTMRVLTVLIGIYLFVAVVAVVISIYFSKRFTSPIREIGRAHV